MEHRASCISWRVRVWSWEKDTEKLISKFGLVSCARPLQMKTKELSDGRSLVKRNTYTGCLSAGWLNCSGFWVWRTGNEKDLIDINDLKTRQLIINVWCVVCSEYIRLLIITSNYALLCALQSICFHRKIGIKSFRVLYN